MRVVAVFEGEVDDTAALVVAQLVRLGVTVDVVCPPRASGAFGAAGASVSPLVVGTGVASLSALRRLLVDGADLVHAYGLRAGLAATLARPGGLPLVLSWSDPVPTAGVSALIARAVTRTVVPAAAAVLAATPALVEAAAKVTRMPRGPETARPGAREVLLAPPVAPEPAPVTRTPEQVREELALPAEGPIVLARGRLDDETRLDVLVAASAGWRRPGGPRVVLVGVGPAYRALVAQATVARAPVTFAGDREVSSTDGDERAGLADLLAAAALAVVTDLRARPEFALRATQAGVPLIVPEHGLLAQLLGDGLATVPAGDVEALDAAVRSLLDEPRARADLVAAARERVAAWPSPENAASDLLGVYERVSRATPVPAADTPGGLR